MLRNVCRQLLVSAIVATAVQTLPAAAQTEKVLHSFVKSRTDGRVPTSHIILVKKDTLYGTTEKGGRYKSGAVFSLKRAGSINSPWSESILYSFSGSNDGRYPKAGLIQDSSGALYGTTQAGGTKQEGVVFELKQSKGSWEETVLHSFLGGSDGSHPYSDLYMDPVTGVLYGATYDGGSKNCGVVFQLALSGQTWVETILFTLGGSSGCNPESGLREDASGNLYGTTLTGSEYGYGNVFMLSPTGGTWTQTVLHSFTGGSDGAYAGRLDLNSAGVLYGVTFSGGLHNDGTVFELTQSGGSWSETVIHNFSSSPDGSDPFGIRLDANTGFLYGTTEYGGTSNLGTVFRLTESGGVWSETVLHSFSGGSGDGALPEASPAENVDTTEIFGTTTEGGSKNVGTVFSVKP